MKTSGETTAIVSQAAFGGVVSKIKKEFLYGGHLFALGSAGVILSASIIGGFKVDPVFLVLIYFIYYLIYLYDHSSGAELDAMTNPIRAEYLKGKVKQEKYVFAASALIIAIILIYKKSFFITGASILTLGLGLMYGSCFKGLTARIVGFKNYFVAAFWGIIVLYAALCHGIGISLPVLFFSVYVFLRMLSVQVFFDIRDTEGDRIKKLRTFPVTYGSERAIKIMYFMSSLSVLVVLSAVYCGYWRAGFLLLALAFVYGMDYIKKYRDHKTYCYLCAAGEPLVWSALVILSNLWK